MPKANTSAAVVCLPPVSTSGAIYVTVPLHSPELLVCADVSGISWLRPKSATFAVKPRQSAYKHYNELRSSHILHSNGQRANRMKEMK